jgi:hypothetical protein
MTLVLALAVIAAVRNGRQRNKPSMTAGRKNAVPGSWLKKRHVLQLRRRRAKKSKSKSAWSVNVAMPRGVRNAVLQKKLKRQLQPRPQNDY